MGQAVDVIETRVEVQSDALYHSEQQGKKDGTDDSNDDGIDEPTLAREAERVHDEATHDGSDNADNDVTDCPKPTALHELAGDEAGDKTY